MIHNVVLIIFTLSFPDHKVKGQSSSDQTLLIQESLQQDQPMQLRTIVLILILQPHKIST